MTGAARRAYAEVRRGLRAQGLRSDAIVHHLVAIKTAGLRAALEAEQLRSDELQRLLGEANREIAQLRGDLAHVTSHASTALAAARYGRRLLGPEEFAAIRGASTPTAQLAARFGVGTRTVEKIQQGTYGGGSFQAWLAEAGQSPECKRRA